MKVKDLIANLENQNPENDVYLAMQDGMGIHDVYEVTDAEYEDETITIILPCDMD